MSLYSPIAVLNHSRYTLSCLSLCCIVRLGKVIILCFCFDIATGVTGISISCNFTITSLVLKVVRAVEPNYMMICTMQMELGNGINEACKTSL